VCRYTHVLAPIMTGHTHGGYPEAPESTYKSSARTTAAFPTAAEFSGCSSPRRRRQGSIHSTYCRKSASQPAATSSWRAQVSFRPCQPSCHRNETRATTVHEYRAGVEDCIGAWLSCCKVRLPRLSPSNIATLRDSGGLKCDSVSSHFAECGGKIPLAFDDKLWWNYETRKAVVVDWVCYGCARLSFARFASRLSSSEAR